MVPFPPVLGGLQFLIVAIDYFTKWSEAEPLAPVIGKQMIKFMWKNILTRFGTPKVLTSKNST